MNNKFLFLKRDYFLILFISFMIIACRGIASLPKEPILIGRDDSVSLAKDEALLFEYALSLNVWLIDAKKYVNTYYKNHKFPLFENFDPQFQGGTGESGLKARISYYKRYIKAIKPIATSVYHNYTQVTLKE